MKEKKENEETIINRMATSKFQGQGQGILETELYYYIKSKPILTKEDELWEFRKPKSKMNKEKIVNGNLRLVYKIAKKYSNKNNNFIELFNSGVLGLNRAIEKYDSTYENRFFTYAYSWILAFILEQIKKNSGVVKNVSVHQHVSISVSEYSENTYATDFDPSCGENDINDLKELLLLHLSVQEVEFLIRSCVYGEPAKELSVSSGKTMRQVYYSLNKAKKVIKEQFTGDQLRELLKK